MRTQSDIYWQTRIGVDMWLWRRHKHVDCRPRILLELHVSSLLRVRLGWEGRGSYRAPSSSQLWPWLPCSEVSLMSSIWEMLCCPRTSTLLTDGVFPSSAVFFVFFGPLFNNTFPERPALAILFKTASHTHTHPHTYTHTYIHNSYTHNSHTTHTHRDLQLLTHSHTFRYMYQHTHKHAFTYIYSHTNTYAVLYTYTFTLTHIHLNIICTYKIHLLHIHILL